MPELAGREKIDDDNLLLLLVLSVPSKISTQVPSLLCMHLFFTRNNSSNNGWALGAGCFVFRD